MDGAEQGHGPGFTLSSLQTPAIPVAAPSAPPPWAQNEETGMYFPVSPRFLLPLLFTTRNVHIIPSQISQLSFAVFCRASIIRHRRNSGVLIDLCVMLGRAGEEYEVELFEVPPHAIPIRCDVRHLDWDVRAHFPLFLQQTLSACYLTHTHQSGHTRTDTRSENTIRCDYHGSSLAAGYRRTNPRST